VLGKTLPLNGAGACGAVLSDLEIPQELLRGVVLLARCAGLLGHLAEEMRNLWPGRSSHMSRMPPPTSTARTGSSRRHHKLQVLRRTTPAREPLALEIRPSFSVFQQRRDGIARDNKSGSPASCPRHGGTTRRHERTEMLRSANREADSPNRLVGADRECHHEALCTVGLMPDPRDVDLFATG
jgi:hypothetical protein